MLCTMPWEIGIQNASFEQYAEPSERHAPIFKTVVEQMPSL